MPGHLKSFIALLFLLPIALAASVKAPVRNASPANSKLGASLLEAWLRKAVDAHRAKENATRTHDDGDGSYSDAVEVEEQTGEEEENKEQSEEEENKERDVKANYKTEDSDVTDDDSSNYNTEDSEVTDVNDEGSKEDSQVSVSEVNNVGNDEDSDGMALAQKRNRLNHNGVMTINGVVDDGNEDDTHMEFIGNKDDSEDIHPVEDTHMDYNFAQKPYDSKVAGSQWRLLRSHLATQARRHKKNSKEQQRSVIYKLKNAAADLERSVQKYKAEDEEEAETRETMQRDLAEQTQEMRQEVDQKLSAPSPAAATEDPPPKKEAPVKEASADPPAAEKDPREMCTELCEHDKGMDADSCVTDCRSYVDAGGDLESLKDFVEDETYNEQGGETMEKEFEGMTGKKVADCKPSIDVHKAPTFESIDTNTDSKISRTELDDWSVKACVPDELSQQVFDVADTDYDEYVTEPEWKEVGENTKMENILDGFADKETKGEDQYEPTSLPEFHHIDTSGDGKLDKDEIMTMFKDELEKRIPNMHPRDLENLASQYEGQVMEDVKTLDLDEDGFLNEDEYGKVHEEGMGQELYEQALNPNNLEDPDDLHRDPSASAAFLGIKA